MTWGSIVFYISFNSVAEDHVDFNKIHLVPHFLIYLILNKSFFDSHSKFHSKQTLNHCVFLFFLCVSHWFPSFWAVFNFIFFIVPTSTSVECFLQASVSSNDFYLPSSNFRLVWRVHGSLKLQRKSFYVVHWTTCSSWKMRWKKSKSNHVIPSFHIHDLPARKDCPAVNIVDACYRFKDRTTFLRYCKHEICSRH